MPFLAEKSNVTVITSGIKTLLLLGEYGINAYSTGGRLLASSFSLVDNDAESMLSSYNANIAFVSCRGISPDGMVTDFSIDENVIRKKMIERSEKAVLLCAGEKIGKTYLHNICAADDFDRIITENDD